MIDKQVLMRSLHNGGKINKAADTVAHAIKNSDKESRRAFVREYGRIKAEYESYMDQQNAGEEIDDAVAEECMKRYLVYKLAFRKLKIDVDSVFRAKTDSESTND